MNEMLPCPGCHTPLPPEATGCQICMRARSKHEILRGYAQMREEKARRRRRPLQIAAAIFVLGAAGKVGWDYRGALRTAARLGRARAAAWYDRFTDAHSYAPQVTAAPAPKSPFATPVTVPPEYRGENPAPAAAASAALTQTPAPLPGRRRRTPGGYQGRSTTSPPSSRCPARPSLSSKTIKSPRSRRPMRTGPTRST